MTCETTRAGLQYRDYQNRVVDKTVGFFEDGNDSVLIESPTGSGKSVMGLRVAKFYEEQYGWRCNWVAMRRNLLSQISEMNDRFFGLKNLQPVSMFDKNPPEAELLISDEAQHDAATSCVHIHASTGAKRVLGLSATPFRTDKLKLAFRKTVKDAGIHRLIQEGWLSPYQHFVTREFTPEHMAHTYLNSPDKWGKTVVFFHTIADCHEFSMRLQAGGVRCEVVSGHTSFREREDQLAAFENDEYSVVANVAILTEGFDCPDLSTVFVRDASRLPTVQMGGRGFRLAEGKSHCNIVQSRNSKWQFTKTAKPQDCYVERDGEWYCLGDSEIVEEVAEASVRQIATIETVMPDFIKQANKKRRRRRWGND